MPLSGNYRDVLSFQLHSFNLGSYSYNPCSLFIPRSLKSTPTPPMGGGPKEFGGTKAFKSVVQRDVIVSFGPPKIIVLSLKFREIRYLKLICDNVEWGQQTKLSVRKVIDSELPRRALCH